MEKKSSLDKLGLAWEQILKQYQKKAEDDAKEYGPGMSIFQMKEDNDVFNCKYFYLSYKSQTWEKYTSFCPEKDSLEKLYDPEKMFIMSVHVPTVEDANETVGNVRLFEFDSYKEIKLES